MPRAKKDSDPFDIEIYKDELLTQLIVKMSAGVRILENNISPGPLTSVTLIPGTTQVQKETIQTVAFTTSHKLEKDSMIEIRFPAGLVLPTLDSSVTVQKITDEGSVPLEGVITKGG